MDVSGTSVIWDLSPGLSLHLCIKMLAENSGADLMDSYPTFTVRQRPGKGRSFHALALSCFHFEDVSISFQCSAAILDDGSLDYFK